jgi:hypothetical protein
MSGDEMDLGAVIKSLENKRAVLDNAIAALRSVLASGASGTLDGSIENTAISYSSSGNGEIPDGAFHGKSMPSAIKLYLELVRSKKTAREIAEGLKKGGLESTSKFFEKIVYATLDRLRKAGEVVKLGTSWGLPAWYPALMRAGSSGDKAPRRKARVTGRSRKVASKNDGPKLLSAKDSEPDRDSEQEAKRSPSATIDWFLRDNPGPHSPEEVKDATKTVSVRVARLLLGQLVKSGKVFKTEDGKYLKAS